MKLTTLILLTISVSALSCNTVPFNKEDSKSGKGERYLNLKNSFPSLYHFIKQQAPEFQDEFRGGLITLLDTVSPQSIDLDTVEKISPFLIFNSDSTYAIGKTKLQTFEEENSGIDVAAINFKYRWRKPLISEPSETVLDANWETDSTILLVCAFKRKDQKIDLSIWRRNIHWWNYELYTSTQSIQINLHNYLKNKLTRDFKTNPSS